MTIRMRNSPSYDKSPRTLIRQMPFLRFDENPALLDLPLNFFRICVQQNIFLTVRAYDRYDMLMGRGVEPLGKNYKANIR